MAVARVHLAVSDRSALADWARGGVFVAGCELAVGALCELVLTSDAGELAVAARVVFAGNGGAGLEVTVYDADSRAAIAAFIAQLDQRGAPPTHDFDVTLDDIDETETIAETSGEGEPESQPESQLAATSATAGDAEAAGPDALHVRLRGLSLAEQLKRARGGELAERILLERMYGKNVWEALLRNPRLTPPEVARIARMGALPRPLIELIVNNATWLQIPEIRRALLSNPRLQTDQIVRVLRLMSKQEIKLAASQTVYPMAVRDAAKRML